MFQQKKRTQRNFMERLDNEMREGKKKDNYIEKIDI